MPRGCAIALLALASFAGLILALLAMAFIVFNETQVDFAALARASRIVRPDDPAAPSGALISLTGTIAVDEPLGDGQILAPGGYLYLERIVEMYAWERYRDGEDSDGKPRYDERRVWTRSPDAGLRDNPPMPFRGLELTAPAAQIGAAQLDPREAELPIPDRLDLQQGHLAPGVTGVLKDGYLYIGSGPTSRPRIGDIRVSYHVVPDRQIVTVFASLERDRLVPYQAADGRAILKVMAGERDVALRDLGAIQVIADWIVRLVAVGALWLGLLLLFAGSRRLFDWPGLLGISAGSSRLATVLGLSTGVLAMLSLWLSGGSLLALAAALAVEALAACAWLLWQRRSAPAIP